MADSTDLGSVNASSALPSVSSLPALKSGVQYQQYTGNPLADAVIAQSNAQMANAWGANNNAATSFNNGSGSNVTQLGNGPVGNGFSNVSAFGQNYNLSGLSPTQLAMMQNNYGIVNQSVQQLNQQRAALNPSSPGYGLANQVLQGLIGHGIQNFQNYANGLLGDGQSGPAPQQPTSLGFPGGSPSFNANPFAGSYGSPAPRGYNPYQSMYGQAYGSAIQNIGSPMSYSPNYGSYGSPQGFGGNGGLGGSRGGMMGLNPFQSQNQGGRF